MLIKKHYLDIYVHIFPIPLWHVAVLEIHSQRRQKPENLTFINMISDDRWPILPRQHCKVHIAKLLQKELLISLKLQWLSIYGSSWLLLKHDDIIKWKLFPRYWPFERGIHRSPVNSPHKGQWRIALMFSLICTWISGWANNHEAGDLRCHDAHYGVTAMAWRQKFEVPAQG